MCILPSGGESWCQGWYVIIHTVLIYCSDLMPLEKESEREREGGGHSLCACARADNGRSVTNFKPPHKSWVLVHDETGRVSEMAEIAYHTADLNHLIG